MQCAVGHELPFILSKKKKFKRKLDERSHYYSFNKKEF